MPNSKLIFTFVDGDKSRRIVSFYLDFPNRTRRGPMLCRFVPREKVAIGEIPILNDASPETLNYLDAETAAQFYASTLDSDYNSGFFTVTNLQGSSDQVTVTAISAGVTFTSVFIDPLIGSVVIENETTEVIQRTRLSIESSVYNQANDTPCGKFKLRLNTDSNYDFQQINNSTTANNPKDSIFEADLLRDVSYVIQLRKTVVGQSDVIARFPSSGRLQIPSLLAENFDVISTSTIESGVITVRPIFVSILSYEYSINSGSTWQTSNVFTGLADGDYTLLIRDKIGANLLGCQISKTFTVALTTNKDPYISISKANSLYFYKQEDTDGITKFKNDTNTVSLSNKGTINYCSESLFENKDETRIQLKSSFDGLIITLRSEDGTNYNLPYNQRTDNLNKFRSLDCVMDYYTGEKSIVYFNSGNEYNEAGAVIDTYSLSGNLPDFAIIGEIVELPGYGVLEIDDVIYLDSINKRCIVVNVPFAGNLPTTLIIKSLYNVLNYNIFDFDIIWSLYSAGTYDVLIEFTDAVFPNEFYLSENINLKEEHLGTVHIRAFNTNNRDIFYKYDIYPTIRVPVFDTYYVVKDEIENNITDNSVEVVRSIINEGTSFTFDELSRENGIKLALFLSCEFVFIDGIGYAKSDALSFEPIEGTNLQTMVAIMLKTQINYNNLININTGIEFGEQEVNVPNFLTQPTNFIKF